MKINNSIVKPLVIATVIVIQACGGSSGDSASNGIENSAPSPNSNPGSTKMVNLSGIVAKGMLGKANLRVEEMSSIGEVRANLGATSTDKNGFFSLPLDPARHQGGVLRITATANRDSQMRCDVAPGCISREGMRYQFGEDMPIDRLEMSAILPDLKNKQHSVHVTPLSSVVEGRMSHLQDYTKGAAQSVLSELSNLLGGISLSETTPVDLSAPSDKADHDAIAYSILASAVARIAHEQGMEIQEVITLLVDDFRDGEMSSDSVDAVKGVTLQSLVDAAQEQYDDIEGLPADHSGIITRLRHLVRQAKSAGTHSIVLRASPTAKAKAADKAKALVQEVRNFSNELIALDSPAVTFAEELKLAKAAADLALSTSEDHLSVLTEMIDGFISFHDGMPSDGVYTSEDVNAGIVGMQGSIRISTNPSGHKLAQVKGKLASGASVELTVVAPTENVRAKRVLVSVKGSIQAPDLGTLIIHAGSVKIVARRMLSVESTESDVRAAKIVLNASIIQAQAEGILPVRVDGDLTFGSARCGKCDQDSLVTLRRFELDGVISNSENQVAVTLSAQNFATDISAPGVQQLIDPVVTFSFNAQLGDLPEAMITMSLHDFELGDDSRPDKANLSMRIEHGGKITIIALNAIPLDGSKPSVSDLRLRFTSQDRVVMRLWMDDMQKVVGDIKMGKRQLATIEQLDSDLVKVTYIDGVFETLP